jgi:hypothetical protein
VSAQTYVHQCPLCQNWQMEYSIDEMMTDFMKMVVAPDGSLAADPKPMNEAIDYVFEEHLRDEHPVALRRFRRDGRL